MIRPSKKQAQLLHQHYQNIREMHSAGFPRRGVQKSFEELVYSVLGKDSWRPTHISVEALKEYCEAGGKNIQRAHGVVPGRMDRIDRTMSLIEGAEKPFKVWWDFFTKHDKTILITRKEHSSGKTYDYSDLIELPVWEHGMFENSGFSVKLRKKTEGVWIHNTYSKVCQDQKEP